jgi:hypothetical protein
MSSANRSSAIGAQPYYGVDGSNRYVESSNLTPSFPSSECLHHGTFKVVVGSWRRLNESKTTSNDFAVNVSAYAPKTTPVTRVTLVDVDIPPTQHLIEEPWSRVYFDQGIYPTAACRAINVDAALAPVAISTDVACVTPVLPTPVCATVLLPLHLDGVTSYQKLASSTSQVVRVFLTHRAPCPIASIAEAWGGLAARGCGTLQLIGVPGLPGGVFTLTPDAVTDDTSLSFDIHSTALYAALPTDSVAAAAAAAGMYLFAAPVPGPSYLGTIVARCLADALTTATYGALALPACSTSASMAWRVDIQYTPVLDRFTLTVLPPESVVGIVVSGTVATYMGLGSPMSLDVTPRHAATLAGTSPRYQFPASYASVAVGSPMTGTAFAARIQSGFDAFCWGSGFSFRVTLPGTPLGGVPVTVPGGNASLDTLASVVRTALNAALVPYGVVVDVTYRVSAPLSGVTYSGLVFMSGNGVALGLDFTVDATFAPARIGYDARVYPASAVHYPTRRATHCPELALGVGGGGCGCATPRSNTSVLYRPDTQELVLQSVPFAPFVASASLVSGHTYTLTCSTTQALLPGAAVILAYYDVGSGAYVQYAGVVVTVIDAFSYLVVALDPASAPLWVGVSITVIPQDSPPLNLYFQRTLPSVIISEVMGFQPRTYSACGELVSPGTVDVRQDPFILLCLGFESPTAAPLTGDVYYPFFGAGHNQLVFAKVARTAGCMYRTDFDKVFDHTFNGSGTTLGYIRVQVLNPNGTPYQTHGHTVSITLKFDTRESAVAFGDGTVSIGVGDNDGDAPYMLGNGRGMVRPPITGGR